MAVMVTFNAEKGVCPHKPLPTVVLESRQFLPPVLLENPTAFTSTSGWNLESILVVSLFGGLGFLIACFLVLLAFVAIKSSAKHNNRASHSSLANPDADFDVELQIILDGRVNTPDNAQQADPSPRASNYRGGNRSGGSRRQSTSVVNPGSLLHHSVSQNLGYPNRPAPLLRTRSRYSFAASLRRIGGNRQIHQTSRSLDGYLNFPAGSHDTLPRYEVEVPPPAYLQEN